MARFKIAYDVRSDDAFLREDLPSGSYKIDVLNGVMGERMGLATASSLAAERAAPQDNVLWPDGIERIPGVCPTGWLWEQSAARQVRSQRPEFCFASERSMQCD